MEIDSKMEKASNIENGEYLKRPTQIPNLHSFYGGEGRECQLCSFPVESTLDYKLHVEGTEHCQTYLMEMSFLGPEEFFEKYGNPPFPDPPVHDPNDWAPHKESDPFMIYALRCGIFTNFFCKGCLIQADDLPSYRGHLLSEEHCMRTDFRTNQIGEIKFRQQHFDVPALAQEKIFGKRANLVFSKKPHKESSKMEDMNKKRLAEAEERQMKRPKYDEGQDRRDTSQKDPESEVPGVYVNGLPAGTTEEKLRYICSHYVAVRGIDILPQKPGEDTVTALIRCPPSDCMHLIEALNGQLFPETTQPVTVKFFDPRKRKTSPDYEACEEGDTKGNSLYVRGLPDKFIADDLKAIFDPYGMVNVVMLHKRKESVLKSAIIRMKSNKECHKVLAAFREGTLKGIPRTMEIQFKRKDGTSEEKPLKHELLATSITIKELPAFYSVPYLHKLIKDQHIMPQDILDVKIRSGSNDTAVGEVKLNYKDDCYAVIKKLHGEKLPGCSRPLVVDFMQNKQKESPPSTTIIVKGYPKSFQKTHIEKLILPLGKIRDIRIQHRQKGENTFSFVDMCSEEDARRVIVKLHMSTLPGQTRRLEVEYAKASKRSSIEKHSDVSRDRLPRLSKRLSDYDQDQSVVHGDKLPWSLEIKGRHKEKDGRKLPATGALPVKSKVVSSDKASDPWPLHSSSNNTRQNVKEKLTSTDTRALGAKVKLADESQISTTSTNKPVHSNSSEKAISSTFKSTFQEIESSATVSETKESPKSEPELLLLEQLNKLKEQQDTFQRQQLQMLQEMQQKQERRAELEIKIKLEQKLQEEKLLLEAKQREEALLEEVRRKEEELEQQAQLLEAEQRAAALELKMKQLEEEEKKIEAQRNLTLTHELPVMKMLTSIESDNIPSGSSDQTEATDDYLNTLQKQIDQLESEIKQEIVTSSSNQTDLSDNNLPQTIEDKFSSSDPIGLKSTGESVSGAIHHYQIPAPMVETETCNVHTDQVSQEQWKFNSNARMGHQKKSP